jgi:hypothetical protein
MSIDYAIAKLVDDEEQGKAYSVNPEYAANIPEAQNLSWEDDFFADDDDVIAVFDLDYELMRSYYEQMGWCTYFSTLIYPPIFALATVPGLVPFFLKQNVEWKVNAQHVAVTRDGIRFVRDRRKNGCGLSCSDVGKNSKTVPFDKITDCDVNEPAGNSCFIIKKVLSTINIDTASSGGGGEGGIRHELQISGLKDPYAFKKLVWAMKRLRGDAPALIAGSAATTAAGIAPTALEMAHRKAAEGGSSDNDVSLLLREIRDELRSNNSLLQNMQNAQDENPAAVVGESGDDNDAHFLDEHQKDV